MIDTKELRRLAEENGHHLNPSKTIQLLDDFEKYRDALVSIAESKQIIADNLLLLDPCYDFNLNRISFEIPVFPAIAFQERAKLIEVLKQTRILKNAVTAARPPSTFKEWYDAVEACSDIKIEETYGLDTPET